MLQNKTITENHILIQGLSNEDIILQKYILLILEKNRLILWTSFSGMSHHQKAGQEDHLVQTYSFLTMASEQETSRG